MNLAHKLRRDPKPIIACDFDGTITQIDVTDLMLERFAHPSWRDVEREWVRGGIGSRECLERQMALIDASAAELDVLIDSVPVDQHFIGFYHSLRSRGIPFYVMTDGFDYVVRRVLRRVGLNGNLRNGTYVFASALEIEGRRLRTTFPHATFSCEHGCATCKAAIIRRLRRRGHIVVFIGDGLSDRFAVREADRVFAKPSLFDYCREKGIACEGFETFAEIASALEKFTGSSAPQPQRARRTPR